MWTGIHWFFADGGAQERGCQLEPWLRQEGDSRNAARHSLTAIPVLCCVLCAIVVVQLLQYLQMFSADMIAKTKTVQNDLDDLTFETNAADIKLQNTFNQLLLLSHTQFIENVGRCFVLVVC